MATMVEEYRDEVPQLGTVISCCGDYVELEWMTGCYSGSMNCWMLNFGLYLCLT